MMKTIKILSLFMLCFLLQACPYEDTPDFYVTIINNSDENVYFHIRGFNTGQEIPENSIVDWDPRIRSDLFLNINESKEAPFDFGNSNRINSFMIYKESTFEENDWETIRDEGLFDARYDLTDEELAEMDYTIEFTGE
ncbi:MAG: hypothetical protein ACQESK_07195 [Bacteroidota bacterium]